jgi:serine/threonine protein kinase
MVSNEAKDFISKLLLVDVSLRMTVDEALQHSWLHTSGIELGNHNLSSNLEILKKFQANKRFKRIGHIVLATIKFQKGIENTKKELKERKYYNSEGAHDKRAELVHHTDIHCIVQTEEAKAST